MANPFLYGLDRPSVLPGRQRAGALCPHLVADRGDRLGDHPGGGLRCNHAAPHRVGAFWGGAGGSLEPSLGDGHFGRHHRSAHGPAGLPLLAGGRAGMASVRHPLPALVGGHLSGFCYAGLDLPHGAKGAVDARQRHERDATGDRQRRVATAGRAAAGSAGHAGHTGD